MAILVIIIIALIAAFMFAQPNSKMDTQINFLSENSLQNGQQIEFELKDSQGNPISGQVNLSFGDEKYSVVTDQNGKGNLTINNENAGKYEITANYGGNDKYNGCSGKTTVTITDESASQTSSSSASSSSSSDSSSQGSSGLHYDAEYGLYYDDDGKVRNSGGQIDGMSIYDIRERGGPFAGIN